MTSSDRERADALLEARLAESGARDPREFYRERLREIKEREPAAYDRAVQYYEQTLIPEVASGRVEPEAAWTRYGRFLAELVVEGRTVAVDATGRASPYDESWSPDTLVLHLPRSAGGRALLVALPRKLSDPQRATYDWLVGGRNRIRDTEG